MKLQVGNPPKWKSKPKVNALDTDVEYLSLRAQILSLKLKPGEQLGLILGPQDGERLGSKHPWRLVRDRIRRDLKKAHLESEFDITCRQTSVAGEWAVWLTYLPVDMQTGRSAEHKDRRTADYSQMA